MAPCVFLKVQSTDRCWQGWLTTTEGSSPLRIHQVELFEIENSWKNTPSQWATEIHFQRSWSSCTNWLHASSSSSSSSSSSLMNSVKRSDKYKEDSRWFTAAKWNMTHPQVLWGFSKCNKGTKERYFPDYFGLKWEEEMRKRQLAECCFAVEETSEEKKKSLQCFASFHSIFLR